MSDSFEFAGDLKCQLTKTWLVSWEGGSLKKCQRPEGNVLFNDALNTFYLRLYGDKHMLKDHSDSERGNPLPTLDGLLVSISSKYSFICTILHTSFQPVLHDWCNKGRGMCYPVCGMVHMKEPLLLMGKSSPCGGSVFPLSLSEWSFTICLTPCNCK